MNNLHLLLPFLKLFDNINKQNFIKCLKDSHLDTILKHKVKALSIHAFCTKFPESNRILTV